jgi:phosphocarrier protein HPr
MNQTPITRTVTVVNRQGLHARAALAVANLVRQFDAKVTLILDGQRAETTEILQMLSLGASRGRTVLVESVGPNAETVADAVAGLFANKFYEEE